MGITAAIMDDTPTTTANEPPPRRLPRRSWSGLAVGAVLGLGLTVLGAPRLAASLAALDAAAVLPAARGGQPVSSADLTAAAAGLERAAHWVTDGGLTTDRGYLLLAAAEQAQSEDERARLLTAAEQATAAGLALAPGQPSAWARLAYLRWRRGDGPAAAAALRLSFLSGATTPPLMESRLALAVELLAHFDADTRALLERQARLFWVLAPDRAAAWARNPTVADLAARGLAGLSDLEVEQFVRFHGPR